MPKVKIPFNATLKGAKKPKVFKVGETAEGEAAEIGAELGCLEKSAKNPTSGNK